MSVKEVEKEIKEEVKQGNKKLEKNLKTEETTAIVKKDENNDVLKFEPLKKEKKNVLSILGILVFIIIAIFIIAFLIFTGYNALNQNMAFGVHIKGIDVSNMSKDEARTTIENYINQSLPQEITLKHGDYQATISLEQIETSFDIKDAVNKAYSVGRQGNLFQNNFYVLSSMFGLPDKVIESSYYIEGNNLIITTGKEGVVVDIDATIKAIKNGISNLETINQPIEIVVANKTPTPIDIDKIHTEIYKEPKDAYYTQDPFSVYPSENGLDFNILLKMV